MISLGYPLLSTLKDVLRISMLIALGKIQIFDIYLYIYTRTRSKEVDKRRNSHLGIHLKERVSKTRGEFYLYIYALPIHIDVFKMNVMNVNKVFTPFQGLKIK